MQTICNNELAMFIYSSCVSDAIVDPTRWQKSSKDFVQKLQSFPDVRNGFYLLLQIAKHFVLCRGQIFKYKNGYLSDSSTFLSVTSEFFVQSGERKNLFRSIQVPQYLSSSQNSSLGVSAPEACSFNSWLELDLTLALLACVRFSSLAVLACLVFILGSSGVS